MWGMEPLTAEQQMYARELMAVVPSASRETQLEIQNLILTARNQSMARELMALKKVQEAETEDPLEPTDDVELPDQPRH